MDLLSAGIKLWNSVSHSTWTLKIFKNHSREKEGKVWEPGSHETLQFCTSTDMKDQIDFRN